MLVHKGGKIKNWGGECRSHTYKIAVSKYQGRCEQRSEVFVKSFFFFFFFWGGGSGRGEGVGGHRVDVNKELKFFVKIKKKKWLGRVGGGGGGVRVDVNKEL